MVEEDVSFVTFDGDTVTKSEFREQIIQKYIDASLDGMTKINDFTIGSEAYHLADVMASFIIEHRELVDLNYRMSMIHTAEGEFLDNFGDMAGVHRYPSSPSVGDVKFTRLNNNNSEPIVIADGSQVATEDAISFIVDNDGADLVMTGDELIVSVICEQEGAYTNVEPNSIILVMGDLGSLVSVTNEAAFTKGSDIEEDDDYRNRILMSPYQVPTGTLAWYNNVANNIIDADGNKVIHDVQVEKGQTQLDADVIIIYNPTDWTDTSIAENDLSNTFTMKEYDVAGVTIDYVLCEKVNMLAPTSNVNYLFAVLLETDYSLDMVKADVVSKINDFNSDALISVEFSPSSLAAIIENEVAGVQSCRIVKYEDGAYTEIVETTSVDDKELPQVDTTDISDRIVKMTFNIDIELEE